MKCHIFGSNQKIICDTYLQIQINIKWNLTQFIFKLKSIKRIGEKGLRSTLTTTKIWWYKKFKQIINSKNLRNEMKIIILI